MRKHTALIALVVAQLVGACTQAAPDADSTATSSAGPLTSLPDVKPWTPTMEPCVFGDVVECPKKCDLGDLESCYFVARMTSDGQGFPKDRKKGAAALPSLCSQGHPDSCNATAHASLRDADDRLRQDDESVRAALPLFERGCALGSSKACNNLGSYIRRETFGRRHESLGYFIRSCELERASAITGCLTAASTLKEGKFGTTIDEQRAATLYQRACRLGSEEGCASATALGLPSSISPTEVVPLRTRYCNMGDYRACARLAIHYEKGQGVGKDLKEAARLYGIVCRGDWDPGASCANLADLHLDGDLGAIDVAAAVEPLRIGCDDDNAKSCRVLADLTVMGQGGITANRDEAQRLYERACIKKAPVGCHQAGALKNAGSASESALAQMLFFEGCSKGDKQSCNALARTGAPAGMVRVAESAGQTYAADVDKTACQEDSTGAACFRVGLNAEKKAKDKVKARTHYDRACRAGHAKACTAMSAYLRAGLGGEKDLDGSVDAIARACVLGHKQACKPAKARANASDGGSTVEARRRAKLMLESGCRAGITDAC